MTQTKTPEPKPCPFCGGEAKAHIWEDVSGDMFGGVECSSCRCALQSEVHWFGDGESELSESVAAWNTRTITPADAAQVLLDSPGILTALAIETMRANKPVNGRRPGYSPALRTALQLLTEEAKP